MKNWEHIAAQFGQRSTLNAMLQYYHLWQAGWCCTTI